MLRPSLATMTVLIQHCADGRDAGSCRRGRADMAVGGKIPETDSLKVAEH